MVTSNPWKLTITSIGSAALILTGCGGADQTPAPVTTETVVTTAPVESTTPAAPATTSADPTDDAVASAGFAAVALAESQVPGGRAVKLDLDDDGTWDVEVIADGREHDFDINADGTQILQAGEEVADGEDVQHLSQASVGITDAITTALGVAASPFDEADLETHNGVVVWDVEFEDLSDVKVDAATGEIVS